MGDTTVNSSTGPGNSSATPDLKGMSPEELLKMLQALLKQDQKAEKGGGGGGDSGGEDDDPIGKLKKQLDKMVKSGAITQDQADKVLQAAESQQQAPQAPGAVP